MREKNYKKNTLQSVLLFAVFVVLLVSISLCFRFIAMVRQSRFDGEHRFTLAFSSKKQSNQVLIVSFIPDTQAIMVLSVANTKVESTGKLLEIPIDQNILLDAHIDYVQPTGEHIASLLQHMFFSNQDVSSNLTYLDIFRLWFFTKSVSGSKVTYVTIRTSSDVLSFDKTISSLFIDNAIVSEKVSMQIINGTDIVGLGNRLAKFITNMGGNVVAISTADAISNISTIAYYGEKTYSVERLGKLLGFTIKKLEKPGISDIIVTIGKDKEKSLQF